MAKGVRFPEANLLLRPPEGVDESQVYPLPVHDMGSGFISKWELSPEDLQEINATGHVWLWILGTAHPPVLVSTSNPFAELNPEPDPKA